MEPGDVIIDGGNEWFQNTLRRGRELEPKGIHFVGMGISGGVRLVVLPSSRLPKISSPSFHFPPAVFVAGRSGGKSGRSVHSLLVNLMRLVVVLSHSGQASSPNASLEIIGLCRRPAALCCVVCGSR